MKPRRVILCVLIGAAVLLVGACTNDRAGSRAPKKVLTPDDIAVGMPLSDFLQIFPQARPTQEGQWNRSDELFGLEGDWTYSFTHKRLSWFIFNSYESQVNQVNFNLYLDSTKKAIAAYTERFGPPTQVMDGVLEFKDPSQGYSGYPVLKAQWDGKNEKVRIDFSFLGSGGTQHQFLFTVEVSG